MQWIKASERLPKDYKQTEIIITKLKNDKGIKCPFNGTYNAKEKVFYLDNLNPRGKEYFNLIEWLDETATPEPIGSGWISIEDTSNRIPTNEDFLILFDNGDVCRHYEFDLPFAIATHWMRIPKLSK